MNLDSYKLNYWASVVSALAAVACALSGKLGLTLINFFFAVFNWYIAEWKKKVAKDAKEDSE
jgi:hypothetical protein